MRAALAHATGVPGAGVIVDALHLRRSGGSAADLLGMSADELPLRAILRRTRPGPATRRLRAEARGDRLYPGDGALDLRALLGAVPNALPISVEAPCRLRQSAAAPTCPPVRRANPPRAVAARLIGLDPGSRARPHRHRRRTIMAEVPISGATRVLTIIGHPDPADPLDHHAEWRAAATRHRCRAGAGRSRPDGGSGLPPNAARLAIMHRAASSPCRTSRPALPWSDETTERARLLGAVNLIRRSDRGRLTGDMVDGLGFIAALRANRFEPAGKNAVVFGAGAVGCALLLSLAEAGIQRIAFSDPDAGRVAALMDLARTARVDDRISAGTVDDLGAVDLAVNASRSA